MKEPHEIYYVIYDVNKDMYHINEEGYIGLLMSNKLPDVCMDTIVSQLIPSTLKIVGVEMKEWENELKWDKEKSKSARYAIIKVSNGYEEVGPMWYNIDDPSKLIKNFPLKGMQVCEY